MYDLFSVNGTELKVGQKNLYKDPCQDWLDLINKKLTSPNYPDEYDSNTICEWNLITEKGHYISLDFEMILVSYRNILLSLGTLHSVISTMYIVDQNLLLIV